MYQRILVAMDGGASSELALEQAMVIARAADAEVELVHVVDDRSPFLDVTGLDPMRLVEDLTTAGERVLSGAASRLEAWHIRHATRLLGRPMVDGDIAATIAAEANGWGADLIVMGTHGRRGVRRLVMGSVARGVIAQAVAPVLLVRAEET
ncbi:Nucleotide-binding universal stress protein, UspA family [Cupriavidus sp. YR651]|uniref:universal stress protein n=1 Tax=Cupriavidus sp. YR651 TaxID=1855315 RepID=UPI000887D3DC|nr:universal stress protein [Cupriavidus sp. YR651]SDD84867.1 Nucleotide-binding universal stress protein, UspA family [Cupriavidus sp. YR651]